MDRDRQIVLMLLRRARQAKRQWRGVSKGECYGEAAYHASYVEAHNAAEYARRILYGTPL